MQFPLSIESEIGLISGIINVPTILLKGSPIIIICYGLNGDRVDNHRLSVTFACEAEKNGLITFRFDYRGCGLSTEDFWNTSLESKQKDILSVIEFLKGCFFKESPSFLLIGYSDGARLVLQVNSYVPEISMLCLWNPIFESMTKSFTNPKKVRLVREPKSKKFVIPLFGLWMGCDYIKQVNENFNIEYLDKLDSEVLIIFGENDIHTAKSKETIYNHQQTNSKTEVTLIPEANHLFSHTQWKEKLINLTINWILKKIK